MNYIEALKTLNPDVAAADIATQEAAKAAWEQYLALPGITCEEACRRAFPNNVNNQNACIRENCGGGRETGAVADTEAEAVADTEAEAMADTEAEAMADTP